MHIVTFCDKKYPSVQIDKIKMRMECANVISNGSFLDDIRLHDIFTKDKSFLLLFCLKKFKALILDFFKVSEFVSLHFKLA